MSGKKGRKSLPVDFHLMTAEQRYEWLSNISIRDHTVDLERVQRLHLGLDSELMEFNAKTVARMIQDIADRCDDDDAFTLHAVVRTLLGDDDDYSLILQQKKPGRLVGPHEWEQTSNRNSMWLAWLAGLERKGVKTEAAVAEIAEAENVSRATVFAGIKSAESLLKSGRILDPHGDTFKNPRPAKKRKT